MLQVIVKVAKSKNEKKYLAVYQIMSDKSEKFITCDFDTVKRLLGLSKYTQIDDKYLEQYEFGQIVSE